MNYRHLTLEERYKIEAWLEAGWNSRAIAETLGRHESTVSRELRRNRPTASYGAVRAQRCAQERRSAASSRPRITAATWREIEAKLRLEWSPEEISGRLRRKRRPGASPERIYQHVLSDRRRGGTLWRHLRCRKRWRKRYGTPRRQRFPNRRSIAQRPPIVDRRGRMGDWEGDTVQFATGSAVLVTLNERCTRLVCLAKSASRKARPVTEQILSRLAPVQADVHTMTLDRGTEFAEHELIECALDAKVYFADAHAPQQRGANEYHNRLIRQYLPRGIDLRRISDKTIQQIEDRLNQRPRKCLDYRTPLEAFNAVSRQRAKRRHRAAKRHPLS